MKLPFKNMLIGEEPEVIQNPYSKEKITLTPEEVAVYDVIKGAEMLGLHDKVRIGIDWFIKNNVKAYMTLLD